MGKDLDWDNLRYFLAVARTGRLTAAATRLHQDHTTISRRIGQLEADLGARLFHRSPQGYRLTDRGRQILPVAESLETTVLTAQAGGAELNAPVSGTVRIGAPDGIGSCFLAPRLGALCRRFPALTPELVAMPRIFSLSRREADIAIGLACPNAGRLFARKLTDYELGLYATHEYLSEKPLIFAADDLRNHTLIGYVEDFIFTPELDYLPLIASGLTARIRSSNLVVQFNATLAGSGICVLPCFMAAMDQRLVRVLGDAVTLTRTFWLITHADLHRLPHIQATSDFIAREARAARAMFLPETKSAEHI